MTSSVFMCGKLLEGVVSVNMTELNSHPFVVFGQEHYNPLGIVRT